VGIVVVPAFGADPVTITGPTLDSKVDGLATEFNGNIDNDNIKSGAAIANSKLNLTSVAQDVTLAGTNVLSGATTISGALTISGTTAMSSKALNFAKGGDIASATTTDIGAATGNVVDVTGTTTITGLGTVQAGTTRHVRFTGALILTHDATSLILPTGANITTAAGDTADFISLGSGNWYCKSFQRKDGTALVGATAATALSGSTLQTVLTQSSAVATDTGTAVDDDTIPTLTECPVISALNTAITASSASNTLILTAVLNLAMADTIATGIVCVFLDAGSAAIAASRFIWSSSNNQAGTLTMQFKVTPADTSANATPLTQTGALAQSTAPPMPTGLLAPTPALQLQPRLRRQLFKVNRSIAFTSASV